jgi:hypothetical protein
MHLGLIDRPFCPIIWYQHRNSSCSPYQTDSKNGNPRTSEWGGSERRTNSFEPCDVSNRLWAACWRLCFGYHHSFQASVMKMNLLYSHRSTVYGLLHLWTERTYWWYKIFRVSVICFRFLCCLWPSGRKWRVSRLLHSVGPTGLCFNVQPDSPLINFPAGILLLTWRQMYRVTV